MTQAHHNTSPTSDLTWIGAALKHNSVEKLSTLNTQARVLRLSDYYSLVNILNIFFFADCFLDQYDFKCGENKIDGSER